MKRLRRLLAVVGDVVRFALSVRLHAAHEDRHVYVDACPWCRLAGAGAGGRS